jgi:hypothetical protein
MKKFIKYLIIILGCALFSTAVHAQKRINTKELVVTDSCTIKAGDPATNKIAVSMDGNGRLKWVYFTDFQDSINQGVFDTIIVDSIYGRVSSFDTVQIRSVITDSSAHLIGRDTNGVVRACYARCEDIRWTTVDGTQTVLRDSTDNVGIGTSSPSAKLHVDGDILSNGEYILYNKDEEALLQISYEGAYVYSIKDTTGASTLQIPIPTDIDNLVISDLGSGSPRLRISDGTQGLGKIFSSNIFGDGSWQAPPIYTGDTLVSGVATAGSFTMPNNFGGLILSGTGTAVSYTLTLPSAPSEGQKILITNNDVAITLLSFAGNGNTLSATLSAGIGMTTSGQRWVTFHNGTWY